MNKIVTGDALTKLRKLDDNQFRTCITSPPYWGLRDYGIQGQIGAENDPSEYIEKLVTVFSEVKRCLTPDGTLWLNIGDSYTSGGRTWRDEDKKNKGRGMSYRPPTPEGLKPKDLVGIPWKLAFALQEDGWFLRSDIIWNKPNCQPESVKDRPTRSHEYVFLLSKQQKYFYNSEKAKALGANGQLKNLRTVWNINTVPLKEAHFATFPPELVSTCLTATSQPGDSVLDPFIGAGTVALVSLQENRQYFGIEVNSDYTKIARKRLKGVTKNLF